MDVVLRHPRGNWLLCESASHCAPDDQPVAVHRSEDGAQLILPLLGDDVSRAEARRFAAQAIPGMSQHPSPPELARRLGGLLVTGRATLARRPRPTPSSRKTAPEEPPPKAPAPAKTKPPESAAPIPLKSLKILRIDFTSDHGQLLDNATSWKSEGKRLLKPDWTPEASHPVSHSKDTRVGLRITVELGPAGASEQEMTLSASGASLSFSTEFLARPGSNTVELRSVDPLPNKIQHLKETLKWTLKPSGDGKALPPVSSGPHSIYVIYAMPRDRIHAEYFPTLKRMDWSVRTVGGFKSLDAHDIVKRLQGLVPEYTLKTDKSVPAKLNHPNYYNDLGDVWPMVDHFKAMAECQAIVRLVRGVLWMLGIPGEVVPVLVFADPVAKGHPAREETFVPQRLKPPPGGLENYKDGNRVAALTDSAVTEGSVYPDSHEDLADGGTSPGFNSFEACLKFTDEETGTTKYYGGGAGTYESIEAVAAAFYSLVWMSEIPAKNGKKNWKIEKILRSWPH